MSELEEDYNYDNFNESGTFSAYTVEVQCALKKPKLIYLGKNEFIFDKKWRSLPFVNGGHKPPSYNLMLSRCKMYSFQTAQTIRWQFHSELQQAPFVSLGIKTRLVKHLITYSLNAKALSQYGVEHADKDGYPEDKEKPLESFDARG